MSPSDGSKPRILLQLDSDPQPSVFDSVVAVDAGVDHLLRHGAMEPGAVRDLVYGLIFTRGVKSLRYSAIFIGGSNVRVGEKLLREVTNSFLGPLRVSVMMDANGANTTAAAAVLAAARHVSLKGCQATVLGATGPVGQRAARLLARQGARVAVCSRSVERARSVCESLAAHVDVDRLTPHATDTAASRGKAMDGAQVIIAAGAAGAQLLSQSEITCAAELRVAVDLNAVPPVGIEGIEVHDTAVGRGNVTCYGAIGVGGTKMKIHKAALRRLFESNDLLLDAEEIYDLGVKLESS